MEFMLPFPAQPPVLLAAVSGRGRALPAEPS
jgi:hypothetical protein